jgi:hypothetical protein
MRQGERVGFAALESIPFPKSWRTNMRVTYLAFCLVAALPSGAAAQQAAATPFWLLPKVELDLRVLTPATVQLVAAPDPAREYALLTIGDYDVKGWLNSMRAANDTGYRVVPGGLKVGALPYADRTYKLEQVPEAFAGLPLLQTKMQHKAILDGRFGILLSTAKPCWVFLAVDERAFEIYKEHGVPAWLQEFAPTGHRLTSDDSVMAEANAGYQVFVKKVPAGRIALGPPCSWVRTNTMYFAFFATAK